MIREGGCLCGAVRFRADAAPGVLACHCGQCQRWTGGGPLLSVQVQDVEIIGEAAIGTYHASTWGERAFCTGCGATLYWRMQDQPIDSLALGLFDDQSGFTVVEEIFTDRRPSWLPAWAGATQSTEAEEMAKLENFRAGDAT
ncbi:MAG: GFA family protein [Roseinatronobacter sp.]